MEVKPIMLTGALLIATGCAHAPLPTSFEAPQPAAHVSDAAAAYLSNQGMPIAMKTLTGVITQWQEVGRETEVIGTNGDSEDPVSDRRRVVIEVQPRSAGSAVTVRAEYEACPIDLPLPITSEPTEACIRMWEITPRQQRTDDQFARRLREAIASVQ